MGLFDWLKPTNLAQRIPLVGRIAGLMSARQQPASNRTTEMGAAGTPAPISYETQLMNLRYERRFIIQDIRQLILDDTRLDKANKKLAREAVRWGVVVTVAEKDSTSPADKAQAVIDQINKNAGISDKLVSWAKMLPAEGDLFLQNVVEDDRLVNVKRMPAVSMSK